MGLMTKPKRRRGTTKATGRNYKSEYKNFQSKPANLKRKAARNRARYALMKKGVVRVGDGMDVDHKNSSPLDNRPSNWRVIPASKNRSYPRTKRAKEKKIRANQYV